MKKTLILSTLVLSMAYSGVEAYSAQTGIYTARMEKGFVIEQNRPVEKDLLKISLKDFPQLDLKPENKEIHCRLDDQFSTPYSIYFLHDTRTFHSDTVGKYEYQDNPIDRAGPLDAGTLTLSLKPPAESGYSLGNYFDHPSYKTERKHDFSCHIYNKDALDGKAGGAYLSFSFGDPDDVQGNSEYRGTWDLIPYEARTEP